MITFRPYQQKLLDETRDAIRDGHRNTLIVLPTGGGKTVVASGIGQEMRRRGKRLWFVVHRDFLLHQTSLTFLKNDLQHGWIVSDRQTVLQPIMLCSQQTLHSRLDKLPDAIKPDAIIWDEAHHMKARTWSDIMHWAGEKCVNVGLTATPQRLDGKGLGPPFTTMVFGPTVSELMEMGNLSRYRAFAPKPIDLQGVRKNEWGEYVISDLEAAVAAQGINADCVEEYRKHGNGMRGVYFCVSIAHSKSLRDAFNAAGIPAEHMDGTTPTRERIAIARRFALGELRVITNVGIMGEGYDLAAQAGMDVTIDLVGLARPTTSLAFHLQMIGRCLRPKPYPAIILDHAGNIQSHGLPDEPRTWSLEGRPKEEREATVKTCPECMAVNPINAIVCSECGHAFSEGGAGRKGPRQIDNELIEIDLAAQLAKARAAADEKQRKIWVRDQLAKAQSYEDVVQIGLAMGYKKGWAFFAWRGEQERRAKVTAMVEDQARAYLRR